MGYVEQNLMPGERVIYQAKLTWAIFIRPFVFFIFGVILLVPVISRDDSLAFALLCMSSVLIVLAVLTLLSVIVSYLTTEFALTDKRIIAKTGIIRRRSLELFLQKVESIGVDQPILGRLLDYGTIVVTGTGGTKEPFYNIASPMELRKHVYAQISGG